LVIHSAPFASHRNGDAALAWPAPVKNVPDFRGMNPTGGVSRLKAACKVATETIHNSSLFPMTAKPDLSLPPRTRAIPHIARAARLFSTAALLLARDLQAQSDPPDQAQPGATKLYSMKFSGGGVEDLERELKAAFPNDNVVVSGSSKSSNDARPRRFRNSRCATEGTGQVDRIPVTAS